VSSIWFIMGEYEHLLAHEVLWTTKGSEFRYIVIKDRLVVIWCGFGEIERQKKYGAIRWYET
jgi:hypothetical protein